LSDSSKIPSRDQRNPLGKIRPSNIKTRPVELRPRQDATDTKPHQKDFIPRPTEVGPRSLLPDPIVNTSNKHRIVFFCFFHFHLLYSLSRPDKNRNTRLERGVSRIDDGVTKSKF
jgi:hypothetical protein